MPITKLYAIRRFFREGLGGSPLAETKRGLPKLSYDEVLAVRQGAYDFIALCDEDLSNRIIDGELVLEDGQLEELAAGTARTVTDADGSNPRVEACEPPAPFFHDPGPGMTER